MRNFALRPKTLKEFIGQERIKRILGIALRAAKKRNEPLDHVLFYGPAGMGKTTLSSIVSNEMGVKLKMVSAPMIERKGDLIGLITSLNNGDILFIDEIHRLNKAIEETIYSAMEDFRVDIAMGSGTGTRSISIDLPRFTLIGATTKLNLLSPPFRSRFGIVCRLEPYSVDELRMILTRNAKALKVKMDEEAADRLSRCSRGTPRILNQFLKRVRDFSSVKKLGIVDVKSLNVILSDLGIDKHGLNVMDRKILNVVARNFNGGPVGLKTISLAVNEDPETIENIHEPYLIRLGLMIKTPRGRKLTPKAYRVINLRTTSLFD